MCQQVRFSFNRPVAEAGTAILAREIRMPRHGSQTNGINSEERARKDYGGAIYPETFAEKTKETETLRKKMKG